MPRSLSINLYLRSFSILLMETSISTTCAYSVFFWSVNFKILVFKLCLLFQIISDLWSVLISEIFSSWDIKKCQFQFLVTFLPVFFWSANSASQVCMSSHGKCFIWEFVVFNFLGFSVFKYLKFVAIFPDLEMLPFWFVNQMCQVCKLHIYFGYVQTFGQYLYFSVLRKQCKFYFITVFTVFTSSRIPHNSFNENIHNSRMVTRRKLPDHSLNRI